MTTTEQFLSMTFVKSRTDTDRAGNLIRVETRKCDRTGLTLTRTSAIPSTPQGFTYGGQQVAR